MSSIRRTLMIAFVVALGSTFAPVSLSPTGGIEVDELCASGTCQMKPGGQCIDQGQVLWNYKATIG